MSMTSPVEPGNSYIKIPVQQRSTPGGIITLGDESAVKKTMDDLAPGKVILVNHDDPSSVHGLEILAKDHSPVPPGLAQAYFVRPMPVKKVYIQPDKTLGKPASVGGNLVLGYTNEPEIDFTEL